ncbi:MAG: antiterminator LoaP [Lachnospiraceae bacterium]|nr:antiterminator LoaP [Lachnospiraceae bacterium]
MWYVAQTVSGREQAAIEKCRIALDRETAARVFTPRCQILKKFHGEWQSVEQIAFQGYIFFDSENPEELEKKLMRIPNVVTPVKIGGGFYPIRTDEEAVLRQMMDENDCIRSSEGYLVDQKLVVENGPLCGFKGKVKKIDRHKRTALIGVCLFEEYRDMRVGLSVKGKLTAEEYRETVENTQRAV